MGELSQFLETFMLLAFGASWPISIMKLLKEKTAKGKSPIFTLTIMLGYAAGIIQKIIDHQAGTLSFPFYCLNFTLATVDLGLYFYFTNKEKKQNEESNNK